jgi:hypothetical protein
MNRRFLLLSCLLLCGCTAQAQREDPYPPQSRCVQTSAMTGSCNIYGVSLVELIANPATYDGLRVRVIGWLNLEFEGNAIYLHREDHAFSITSNGLWVQLGPGLPREPACNKGYALIEGRFEARNHGHLGLWSGAIVDIDRCMPWGERSAPVPAEIPPPAR